MTLQKGQELAFEDEKAVAQMEKTVGQLNLPEGEQNTFTDFFRCVNLCHDCISIKSEAPGKEG